MLEPPESHAEHCATVAVYGVILSGLFEADPAPVFLAGLAHHLHNAGLPDSGFTGEELLGEHLPQVAGRFREAALEELPAGVREEAEACLELTRDADSPEGRAFHAADVLDRVLQMQNYERQAGFTLDQALGDMDLVHPGPLKEFQDAVISRAGLR
jgi:5'-deoxynucleotidase YfbR-like HD superfamily hydrolase